MERSGIGLIWGLSRYFPGGTKENNENHSIASLRVEISPLLPILCTHFSFLLRRSYSPLFGDAENIWRGLQILKLHAV
jgi:hypothetical protein